MAPPTVCLLDGERPPASAALGLLSQHDVQVTLGHSEIADVESIRRCGPCLGTHAYPDPRDPTSDFEEHLIEWLIESKPDVVLPLSREVTEVLARHRDPLLEQGIALPIPTETQLTQSRDRILMLATAEGIGLSTPRHVRPTLAARTEDLLGLFPKPPALAPRLLDRPEPAQCPPTHGLVLHEREIFERRTGEPPILLERLNAEHGWIAVTALCDAPGGIMASVCEQWTGWDSHLRQPRWRTIVEHPGAIEATQRLLAALQWTGPATLQFATDPQDDGLHLLQLWPGIGGGLDLIAGSGLDLIWPLVEWALGQAPTQPRPYQIGLHMPWEADGIPWLFTPDETPIPNLTPHGERYQGHR